MNENRNRRRRHEVFETLERRGLTVADLARRIGRSYGNTYPPLAGHVRVTRELADAIAGQLDLPLILLFPGLATETVEQQLGLEVG